VARALLYPFHGESPLTGGTIMTLYLGMQREILIVDPAHPKETERRLDGTQIAAIATDPYRPDRVLCCTFDQGLWRSDDRGDSWTRVEGIPSSHMQSVAFSQVVSDLVFAGSEPSALYRSDDGGDTWRELDALPRLPSASTWSFPPKPETHHVRWITPHPTDPRQVFVAIEAGALVQSRDGGETWKDRVQGGPYDSHTVLIHPERPDRLISAAGDGFFESVDRGRTWRQPQDGLSWRYCWGLAMDASDPDTALMSIAPHAGRGHGHRRVAQAAIVRRRGNGDWHIIKDGLPEPDGTTLSVLVADPETSGTVYAANNTGLYRSRNSGDTWTALDVPWNDEYLDQRPNALAVSPA
jgi:photosystem II stability/assembly factor-like uncharacterized protein